MPEQPLAQTTGTSHQARKLIFALSVLAVLVMSLLPVSPDQPTTGWDKANHLLGFAVLTLLGSWAYPDRMPAILSGLFAHGALIEVLQSFTGYRTAEWGDLLADALGVLLGWGLVRIMQAVSGRRRRHAGRAGTEDTD